MSKRSLSAASQSQVVVTPKPRPGTNSRLASIISAILRMERRVRSAYDYELKAAKDVAPAPSTVGIGMTVSPDESELLYAADEGGAGSDLALVEFANAPR